MAGPTWRRLLGGDKGPSYPNMDHCTEVIQPDNVYDANLRYKSTGQQNRVKFIKDGEGLYAGVLDTYSDMPVDLQTGKMCVFLQSSKPQPKIGIHLAGIRAKGDSQQSPYMNCYSKKGAASYSYVDVNYAKGDDILSMPLTYDYFDYMGDSYIKDTAPLIDASPTFIGNAVTCELLKENKRTVILTQTFDFEHVMRHCHLHDDPGVAGKESAIFKKGYTRRRLLGSEDTTTTKEKIIPYLQKFVSKNAVGAKQCCAEKGEWKFCIYSTELPVTDERVAVGPGRRNCSSFPSTHLKTHVYGILSCMPLARRFEPIFWRALAGGGARAAQARSAAPAADRGVLLQRHHHQHAAALRAHDAKHRGQCRRVVQVAQAK
jgi:hypothetical protein